MSVGRFSHFSVCSMVVQQQDCHSFVLSWQYLTRRRAQQIHSFAVIMIACCQFSLTVGLANITAWVVSSTRSVELGKVLELHD